MATDWKAKYLDLIDSQEKLGTELETTTQALRRALVQVSLLADGQQVDLDDQLSELRKFLRSGSQLDKITDYVDDLEQSHEATEQNIVNDVQTLQQRVESLEDKLLSIPLSKEIKKDLKNLRKTISKNRPLLAEVPILFSEFLLIIERVLSNMPESLSSEPAKPKYGDGGFWGKFFSFGKSNQPANDDDETYSLELPDDQKANEILTEIEGILAGILTRLSYPDDQLPVANELLQKIQNGIIWENVISTLKDTAELIIVAVGNGQQDFQNFLEVLNERLDRLQNILVEVDDHRSDIKIEREAFKQFLQDQVTELKQAVNQPENPKEDIYALRQYVLTQVEVLIDGLGQYRKKEETREAELNAKLENLSNRLVSMENEARAAKEALLVQQLKANTDSLTGLLNREAFQRRLDHERKRMERYKQPLSLIICDIDFFKRVNDEYGHLAGDKVLSIVAKVCQAQLRDIDMIARYGGEEFVVLLPETHEDGAIKVAEKIRKAVEASPFHFKGQRVNITMSLGVCEYQPDVPEKVTFQKADEALYRAKDSGRNQVQRAA